METKIAKECDCKMYFWKKEVYGPADMIDVEVVCPNCKKTNRFKMEKNGSIRGFIVFIRGKK